MTLPDGQIYGDGSDSSIGTQLQTYFYQKQALVDLQKEKYFSQLADTTNLPKNFGKTIKRYHYIPLLDDRNVNDQGIDAAGAILNSTKYYVFSNGALVPNAVIAGNSSGFASEALALAAVTDADTQVVTPGYGNLYGSSKDIGTIQGKLPVLSETGGRVNRVGFSRREIEGTFHKFGFFYEWSQEFVDFDSDPQVLERMYAEALKAAEQIQEDMLQIDLLNGAGTLIYAGSAVSDATMNDTSQVTVNTLRRLSQALTANDTPKSTKIITGSTMVDTRTATTQRIMFVGSELKPLLENMLDNFGNPALIPSHQYGAATKLMEDEIGIIGD